MMIFITILLMTFCGIFAQNCESDPNLVSYCTSCLGYELCPTKIKEVVLENFDINPYQYIPCPNNEVCDEDGNIAFCANGIIECTCPPTGLSTICDPYNVSVILTCYNGIISDSKFCGPDEICVAPGSCSEAPSTTTPYTFFPPDPEQTSPSCSDDFIISPKNCTAFYVCSDGVLILGLCESGQVTENTGDAVTCIDYVPFTCPAIGVGAFGDHFNCSVFYNCNDGTQLGDVQICPDGASYFDSNSRQCTDDPLKCDTNECTPCLEENEYIGVNCTSYFECHKSGGFYTILKSCSPGYFSEEIGNCTSSIPAGC